MKNYKLFIVILFAIIATTIISCEREDSADVNQDRIYTKYELFYNANEDKTYARAIFRFGNALGTLLELSEPSQVSFNGDVLSFKPALAYYEKEYAGFIESGTFTWQDTEGVTYINTATINNLDFPEIDTIPRNAAFELFWVGDSLSSNEVVTLTANSVLEGDAQLFTQSNINAKSIILELNKLQILGQGNGTLLMERHYNPQLEEKTGAGGEITGRYRPVNKEVYFD